MLISFIRSSSWNNYDFCQQQYFINYVLGIERKVGVKADIGTATHKVLECVALIKKQFQDEKTDKIVFFDEILDSPIHIHKDDLLKETILSDKVVDAINKTRINKYKYEEGCFLQYGHKRFGVDIVDLLINKSTQFYGGANWQNIERSDCNNWSWMALDYKNGMFDPRKREIFQAEQKFDIELKKPWSKFSYEIDGKKNSGFLSIKGTVDLIYRESDDILEVVDYKTGQRKNWATGEIKTFKTLCKDFQLMLYYYAMRKLFPQFKHIMVTIFFIRAGGPYTVHFDDKCLEQVELKLCEKFHEIQRNIAPKMCDPLQKDFKCTKICDYYKMTSPKKDVNFCKFIHDEINNNGIDYVTNTYKNINHHIDKYQEPGATK